MTDKHRTNTGTSSGRTRGIIGAVVGMIVMITAIAVQQFLAMRAQAENDRAVNAQTEYNRTARRLVDDMQATLLLAEDNNTTLYDVWYYSARSSSDGLQFLMPVTRVIRIGYDTAIDDPEMYYEKFISDENKVGYLGNKRNNLEPEAAVLRVFVDPAYRINNEKVRENAISVRKTLRALKPLDADSLAHQKLIRMYALFEQYVESTIIPPNNYTVSTTSLHQLATEFVLLRRELNIELP